MGAGSPPRQEKLPLDSWVSLLSRFAGKIVILESERADDFYIGRVQEISGTGVVIRSFDGCGKWTGNDLVRFSKITRMRSLQHDAREVSEEVMDLLDHAELERSWAVANFVMNCDRGLTDRNGYTKELGFSPLDFLRQRLAERGAASWLDLCCGNGCALSEALSELTRQGATLGVELAGVDLVRPSSPVNSAIHLETASLHQWEPPHPFDLITCVHGLHYLGINSG